MLDFCSKSNGVGGSGGYLGGLGIIRLHVRQIEQRNTTGLSFVLSRILFCFFLRRLASFNFNMAFFVSWGDKLQNVNILSFSIIWHLQGDNGGIIALFFQSPEHHLLQTTEWILFESGFFVLAIATLIKLNTTCSNLSGFFHRFFHWDRSECHQVFIKEQHDTK